MKSNDLRKIFEGLRGLRMAQGACREAAERWAWGKLGGLIEEPPAPVQIQSDIDLAWHVQAAMEVAA